MGRRKSWVVPVQLLVGLVLVILSYYVDGMIQPHKHGKPQIFELTACFFVLYFLVATQDIAVDAWALTMLSPPNIGYNGFIYI